METSVNNKCRAFTSLEQSKKLAEILPLESADMCCFQNQNGDINYYGFPFLQGNKASKPIPCWSLASLLDVLPNNKHISTTLSRGGWKIEPVEYIDKWWCEYEDDDYTKDFSVSADNPVDACVEMIIRLHELKML